MSLPLQHEMNMDDPQEHVLWALLSMDARQGVPMLVPLSILRAWSRHLWRCGFRHHPDMQEIYYRPPSADSALSAIDGQWVEADTPGVNPLAEDSEDGSVAAAIDSLPDEVVAAIIARHKETTEDGERDE